ncbi:PfkB family carbohydrate kinase [Primorskyibacter sp. S87]|uniref:PfkB family carbohydrate kinase n=1 Tax=Primorskyibacter sp. S87 TaxID=3415126 RepID=UPI003C7D13AD
MTTPVILCCGEAVLDLVPAPLADGSNGLSPVPGGAAVNTSVALARQNVPSGFLGALSRDTAGDLMAGYMRQEGVDLTLTPRLTEPSTISFARPIPGGTHFDLHDFGSAGQALRRSHLPELSDTTRTLVLGGISLIPDLSGAAFETLAAQAGPRLVWLDLNIRPGLVTDPDSYRARLNRMMSWADVIKVSDEDLDWLGCSSETLRDHHPNAMLLHSRGADGAEIWSGEMHAALPCRTVPVVDTVGAGDILNAGMLAWLYHAGLLHRPLTPDHRQLTEALAAGIEAATFSVSRPGSCSPNREEVSCAP